MLTLLFYTYCILSSKYSQYYLRTGIQSLLTCLWKAKHWIIKSRYPAAGSFDWCLQLLYNWHVIGTVHLYKYWPLIHFPPTVHKYGTDQSNHKSCHASTTLYLTVVRIITEEPSSGKSMTFNVDKMCYVYESTATVALVRHNSLGNAA
jgi:hypothetical protein